MLDVCGAPGRVSFFFFGGRFRCIVVGDVLEAVKFVSVLGLLQSRRRATSRMGASRLCPSWKRKTKKKQSASRWVSGKQKSVNARKKKKSRGGQTTVGRRSDSRHNHVELVLPVAEAPPQRRERRAGSTAWRFPVATGTKEKATSSTVVPPPPRKGIADRPLLPSLK